ncbi:hypothetical protein GCM10010182_38070 [Actinomadura cremea]|nr:hypothetical protein GCM10010182_38070 [Actinomadura cremea]
MGPRLPDGLERLVRQRYTRPAPGHRHDVLERERLRPDVHDPVHRTAVPRTAVPHKRTHTHHWSVHGTRRRPRPPAIRLTYETIGG